ncbi:uncharacterized protein GGS22DRAFT_104236 [Annulohypoxylon maeteangense]|uniref:uncharacterized protein n=1 Tax=Annulohypoxylon maeteangense TaxID=1927788 RepID=UPI002008543D|nr:uncharacterized protein GGS22DRAFT_104236 [Annulohypoxylon maeteangense]KAI0887092.1 hypothetical protein GGS22DRAFT_104236 [Annulohypoxylon maeteangense]
MASSSQPPTPQRSKALPPNAGVNDRYSTDMSHNVVKDIAAKSIQTGAAMGAVGMLFGAGAGIVRSAPPVIFAFVAGLQWFGLGSTYMASKSVLLHSWGGEENITLSDRVKASGTAGGVSGMVGGMIRGPRNIIPGILVFGTLGGVGEYLSQRFKDSSRNKESKPKSSWLDSRWSPMRKLSDKEYEEMLEQKILRINAEISIIDDSIASLRESSNLPTNSSEEKTK